jgi:hypothetical protein
MSKIPYTFTAIPKFFRQSGMFKNAKNVAFVMWCFERCSPDNSSIFFNDRMVELDPYEFIFGRTTCSEETGLTENEIRTQLKRWENCDLLKKTTSKTTNRFSVYKWSVSLFLNDDHQLNHQQTTSRPPADHHNQEAKNLRIKERTSSSLPPSTQTEMTESEMMDELNDFFPEIENSSKAAKQEPDEKIPEPFDIEKFKPQAHKIKKENREYIEVYPGVSMTLEEYGECIQVKGSREAVLEAVTYIMTSTSRTRKIRNWPNAMAKWLIPKSMVDNSSSNELRSRRLEAEWEHNTGWRCLLSIDPKKGERGLLFFNSAAVGLGASQFVALKDPDFNNKVDTLLRDKKMQKSRLKA